MPWGIGYGKTRKGLANSSALKPSGASIASLKRIDADWRLMDVRVRLSLTTVSATIISRGFLWSAGRGLTRRNLRFRFRLNQIQREASHEKLELSMRQCHRQLIAEVILMGMVFG